MANKKPFNIDIFSTDDPRLKNLGVVSVPDIYSATSENYHPQGFYSTEIFGPIGSSERDRLHGIIKLNTKVINPKYLIELLRLKGLYKEIIYGTGYASWDNNQKDFVRSNALDGDTGFAFFMTYLDKLELKENKSIARQTRIEFLRKHKSKALVDKLIVLPAGLRDLDTSNGGRPIEHELTKMYRSVLNSAETIPLSQANKNNPILDSSRANIQRKLVEIFLYLEGLLAGKRGLFRGKWSKRRVAGSSRNVLTSIALSAESLNSSKLPSLDDVQVGVFQFVKSHTPITMYEISRLFTTHLENMSSGSITLYNVKTLQKETFIPTQKSIDSWTTDAGLESISNNFGVEEIRDLPILLDGRALCLVYVDDKYIAVVDSVTDVPSDYDSKLVRPITWGEMFYIASANASKRVRCFAARYPIETVGSIFAARPYVKSTFKTTKKELLDRSFTPTGILYEEYPVVGSRWVESMAVHHAHYKPLGADTDGDMLNYVGVNSDEGVKEVDEALSSMSRYIKPSGALNYELCGDITEEVFNNFY